jgi:hypothetical protein
MDEKKIEEFSQELQYDLDRLKRASYHVYEKAATISGKIEAAYDLGVLSADKRVELLEELKSYVAQKNETKSETSETKRETKGNSLEISCIVPNKDVHVSYPRLKIELSPIQVAQVMNGYSILYTLDGGTPISGIVLSLKDDKEA